MRDAKHSGNYTSHACRVVVGPTSAQTHPPRAAQHPTPAARARSVEQECRRHSVPLHVPLEYDFHTLPISLLHN